MHCVDLFADVACGDEGGNGIGQYFQRGGQREAFVGTAWRRKGTAWKKMSGRGLSWAQMVGFNMLGREWNMFGICCDGLDSGVDYVR